jgi:hypothetical protein
VLRRRTLRRAASREGLVVAVLVVVEEACRRGMRLMCAVGELVNGRNAVESKGRALRNGVAMVGKTDLAVPALNGFLQVKDRRV